MDRTLSVLAAAVGGAFLLLFCFAIKGGTILEIAATLASAALFLGISRSLVDDAWREGHAAGVKAEFERLAAMGEHDDEDDEDDEPDPFDVKLLEARIERLEAVKASPDPARVDS